MQISIAGLYDDWRVQGCRAVAADICISTSARGKNYTYEVRLMSELEWEEYCSTLSTTATQSPVVLLRGEKSTTEIGGLEDLEALGAQELGRPCNLPPKKLLEKSAANQQLIRLRKSEKAVFFNVRLSSTGKPKKIVIELLTHLCPKTCEKFLSLCCSGEYRGSPFSLGKSTVEVGKGCDGDYADESFAVPFDRPGLVATSSSSSNHFFITLDKLPALDKRAVAFGSVVKGIDALRQIGERIREGENDCCSIVSSGVVSLEDGFGLLH